MSLDTKWIRSAKDLKLVKEWESKLKASGFKDIEFQGTIKNNTKMVSLEYFDNTFSTDFVSIEGEDRYNYYDYLSNLLWNTESIPIKYRKIAELLIAGKIPVEIAKELGVTWRTIKNFNSWLSYNKSKLVKGTYGR